MRGRRVRCNAMLGRIRATPELTASLCTPETVTLHDPEQGTDTETEEREDSNQERGVPGPLLSRFNPGGRKPGARGTEQRESHEDPSCQGVASALPKDEKDAA